jgi:hypothetical protein
METVKALVDALGGTAAVSEVADVERNTVTYWERRQRIPAEHWDALIALAKERHIKGVDHALMHALHTPRKPRSERANAGSAA